MIDIESVYHTYLQFVQDLHGQKYEKHKGWFSASSAGSCYRKQLHRTRGDKKTDLKPRNMRLLRLGTIVHNDIEKAFKYWCEVTQPVHQRVLIEHTIELKELNVIVKGDVAGSIEALSDSLEKLTTDEISVNIIHKSVGQISESDVMLASASEAVIVGFQVRPSVQARRLAETEQIDIRLYSVIYKAIEELKQAMEGMLSPDIKEEIVCSIEIREIFKISKVKGIIEGGE